MTVDFLCGSKKLPPGMGISLGNIPVPKEDFTTPHIPDLQPELISCSLGSTQAIPGGAALTHSHTVREK